jgi:hypothetical protein
MVAGTLVAPVWWWWLPWLRWRRGSLDEEDFFLKNGNSLSCVGFGTDKDLCRVPDERQLLPCVTHDKVFVVVPQTYSKSA